MTVNITSEEKREILRDISQLQDEILILTYHQQGLEKMGIMCREIPNGINLRKASIEKLRKKYEELRRHSRR